MRLHFPFFVCLRQFCFEEQSSIWSTAGVALTRCFWRNARLFCVCRFCLEEPRPFWSTAHAGAVRFLGNTSLFFVCLCVCRFCWEERRPLWSTADVPAARFLEEHYQEFREELDVLLSVEGSFDQFHNVLPPPVDKQRCLETTAPKIPCSAAYKMGLWVALLTN